MEIQWDPRGYMRADRKRDGPTDIKLIGVLREYASAPENYYYYYYFFFFFCPLWALACRTTSFHFFLSVTNALHHR
jgi:hypothetical protein